ncbi:phage holin family protein [Maledivibacter halophilus]|uniref:Toxin secretion/phage lysis holin n=1 Tax=Maledivibacter halophilus TaxID=36842 RepID=A0A1T5K1T0_9FIRM|nr:phage holin family protein [Maledivibacter halophilus]SKC57458.1 toxin secretion/phage lysis holin [Maledivibacter halophilus]
MDDILNFIKAIFTAIGGYLGYVLGGHDSFLYALIAFVVIDYITGVMLAIIKRKVSSAIGFKGIFKKIMVFLMVAIGHTIDAYLIKNGGAIRTAVIFFYISNEGISILENSANIGLPIPEKLKEILVQLKDGEKNE